MHVHVQFEFCSRMQTYLLLTLCLLLRIRLLLPVRLLIVAGHENLPTSAALATKEERRMEGIKVRYACICKI